MFNERTAFNNSLSMRWFTPRGQAIRQELLDDLLQHEGAHAREILEPLRRSGVGDEALDLRGIDLEGEPLAGAQLPNADLTGAILVDCDLKLADLSSVSLRGARLVGADLRRARLEGSDLSGADLRRVDLTEASLEGACLREALVAGACFRRTLIKRVDLTAVDLREVDLTQAFRTDVSHRIPPRPTRRRERVGRPPRTEPRRATSRPAPPLVNARPPTARYAQTPLASGRDDGRVIPFDPPRPAAAPPAGFDGALVELLSARDRVERIVAVIDGVEQVLLQAPLPERSSVV